MRTSILLLAIVLFCGVLSQSPANLLNNTNFIRKTIDETLSNQMQQTQQMLQDLKDKVQEMTKNVREFMSDDEINRIQQAQRTWTAKIPDVFKEKSMDELKLLVAKMKPLDFEPEANTDTVVVGEDDEDNQEKSSGGRLLQTIPSSFDSRTKWGTCIGAVRNQGSCGSCWAFATVSPFEDRLCIAGRVKPYVQRSPQYLVDCDTKQSGCNGGNPNNAWSFVQKYGAPAESCYPYKAVKGTCPSKCNNGLPVTTAKAKSVVTYKSIASVKNDLMTYGPIETWMAVYKDFYYYKSGVYQPTTDSLIGYHAVKVIGWGYDTYYGNYWIVQNTWGTSWGEKGFFRIKAGTCQIDNINNFVAGYV